MESERHLSPEDEEQMESDIINSVMADLFPPSLDDHNNNNNNNKRSSVRFTETTVEITTNGHADDTVTSFTDHDVTYYNNDVTVNGDDVIESVVDKSDDEDDVTNNHDDVTNVNNEVEHVDREVVVEETNEYGFNFDDIIGNLGRKDDERNDYDVNEEEAEKADEAYEMMVDEQLDHFEKEVASELESMIEEELTKDFQEGFEEGANEMVGALSVFIGGGEYGNKTAEEEKVEEQEQEQKQEDQPVYEVLEPAVDYEQHEEINAEENIYELEKDNIVHDVIIDDQVDNNDVIISHDDEVYDDNHVSDIAEEKLRHDDVIAELKQDIKEKETTTCSCTCKCKCSTSHHHTADHTQVTSAELQQTSDAQTKQRPPSTSGTFVLRTVAKANPQHVVKYVTENQANIVQHNPEQDELVTYLKGTSEGGSIQNRIRSLITSPLIQQFNKETGSENVQTFLPKQVMVANRAPSLSIKLANGANGTKEPETPQITQEVPVVSPQVEKMVIESISDPQARNAELAKAIEAAQFKPTHTTQASIQISRTPRASEEGEERTVSVGQGISIYSRQPNTPSSAGVLSPGVAEQGLEWKAEVQRRKQANELIVAQKVNEPIKLAQVPEWKRVLMEKNKQRKQSSNEAEDEHKNGVKPSDEGNTELEWKKEIKQILREKERNGQTAEEMPEWQRIANKQ